MDFRTRWKYYCVWCRLRSDYTSTPIKVMSIKGPVGSLNPHQMCHNPLTKVLRVLPNHPPVAPTLDGNQSNGPRRVRGRESTNRPLGFLAYQLNVHMRRTVSNFATYITFLWSNIRTLYFQYNIDDFFYGIYHWYIIIISTYTSVQVLCISYNFNIRKC